MKLFLFLIGIIGIFFITLLVEGYIATQVKLAPFTDPSPEPVTLGEKGKALTYVVLGDSTAAGQGAKYSKGIAMQSATHLSEKYTVTLTNFSFSGAKVSDVLSKQLPKLEQITPDLVLISVGANDVTHITSLSTLEENLGRIVTELRKINCDVKIVLTGSPAMETTRLFAQPLRFVSGLQGRRVNNVFDSVIEKYDLTHAPIALKTKPYFLKDDSLFSSDRFHPNEKGYAVWSEVINEALDKTLKRETSSCKLTF